jgi:hypothetical protein
MATSPSAYFPHLILPKGQQIKDGLYCILRDAILEGAYLRVQNCLQAVLWQK